MLSIVDRWDIESEDDVEVYEDKTSRKKGGRGSGNFGHEGRPGEVGGSGTGGREGKERARGHIGDIDGDAFYE